MLGSPQHDFRITELDSDLLLTPFKLQTNWHVITGSSCSGKTTLINQLAEKGFRTIPEVARQYFEREIAKGRSINEIREERVALTYHISGMQQGLECGLRAADTTFLDRALPDSFVFYRIAGRNPNELLSDCFKHRYASVFMLNRLPYQRDGVRTADDAIADYYDEWIARDYSALGYNVVRVPIMSPKERLAFVLEKLSEQGLL